MTKCFNPFRLFFNKMKNPRFISEKIDTEKMTNVQKIEKDKNRKRSIRKMDAVFYANELQIKRNDNE